MSQRHTRQMAAALAADVQFRPGLAGSASWDALITAIAEARACTTHDAAYQAYALRCALKPIIVAVHEAGHAVAHLKSEEILESRLLRLEWYGPGQVSPPPGPNVDAATLAESVLHVHPGMTRAALFAVLAGPYVVPAVFPRAAAAGLIPTEEWGPDLDFALEIQDVMIRFFQDVRTLRAGVLRRIRGKPFVRAVLPVAGAFLALYPGGTLSSEQVRCLSRQKRHQANGSRPLSHQNLIASGAKRPLR